LGAFGTVKCNSGIDEVVRMALPRGDRPAMSTTAFAVLLIIVLVVGGAVGIYYPRASQKASSSSTTSPSSTTTVQSTSASSSAATSSSTAASSSTTSSSVSSNTTAIPPAPPLFNFTVSSAPSTILISPGTTIVYPNVVVTPLPSAYLGQAAGLNYGAGDELVVLNTVEASGLSIQFFGSTLMNTIYEEVSAGLPNQLELQVIAAPSIAPGNYPVTVEASSGTLSVNYTFSIQVVQYLVAVNRGLFDPGNLNVTAGSTVYWINVSTDPNGYSNVVFANGVTSPGLFPCVINTYGPTACTAWSYTFTTAGTFSYVCNAVPACGGGTVNVTG
jgi:plastocyanin